MKLITERNFSFNCPKCNEDLSCLDNYQDGDIYNINLHCDKCDIDITQVFEFSHTEYYIEEDYSLEVTVRQIGGKWYMFIDDEQLSEEPYDTKESALQDAMIPELHDSIPNRVERIGDIVRLYY
jgi:hypothetical protein